jgi:hypothetical protein
MPKLPLSLLIATLLLALGSQACGGSSDKIAVMRTPRPSNR